MTLLITDYRKEILSQSNINPGLSIKIENKITDQYLSVINWYKDKYQAIHLQIKFFPPANNFTFHIRYKDLESASDRSRFLDSPFLMDDVFSQRIALLIDATLDFTIETKDGRKDAVMADDIAIISCISRDGVPQAPPRLHYIDKLNIKSRKFFPSENKIVVHVYLTKSDHHKYIKCSSSGVSKTLFIYVFHHPTSVEFMPRYSNTMPNGSSVLCMALDGYPNPQISWQFLSGPPNASQYYTISGNNLTMLSHCPIESRWTFNCSAINSIPRSYDMGTTRTFSFTVSPASKVAGVVLGTVFSIIVLLAVVFCVMRRKDYIKSKLPFMKPSKKFDKNSNDDAMNNLSHTAQFYTYSGDPPDHDTDNNTNSAAADNTSKSLAKKKLKKKQKQKKDPLVDSQNDEFIV